MNKSVSITNDEENGRQRSRRNIKLKGSVDNLPSGSLTNAEAVRQKRHTSVAPCKASFALAS